MRTHIAVAGVCLAAASARAEIVQFAFFLNGAQETPPVATSAFGFGVLNYDTDLMNFDLDIVVDGIALGDLTGNHIHVGPPGVAGPVVIDLSNHGAFVDDVGGTIRMELFDVPVGGSEADLLGSNLYVNIHTQSHLSGEIRGQIVPATTSVAPLAFAGLFGLRRRRRS